MGPCGSGRTLLFYNSLSIYARGRGTYTAGKVNSVTLLKVARKNVDFPCCAGRQKCTKLHISAPTFSKNFQGWHPGSLQLGGPPQRTSTVPLFQSFHVLWSTLLDMSLYFRIVELTQHICPRYRQQSRSCYLLKILCNRNMRNLI